MARTKTKNSYLSFKGWGLTPEEDKEIIQALKDKDLTANQLIRVLIRKWVAEQKLSKLTK